MDPTKQREKLNRIIKEIKDGTLDLEKERDTLILIVKHAAWARLLGLNALEYYSHRYKYKLTEHHETIPRGARASICADLGQRAQNALLKFPGLYRETFAKELPNIKQWVREMDPW
jgi:hypothetical protein